MRQLAGSLKVLVSAFLFLLLVTGSGAAYEAYCRRCAIADFPPPGKMVSIGAGRRIQIDCRGIGSPTVVFESGFGPGGPTSWSSVQQDVAGTTRSCSYSRAGIMWSDPASTPRSPYNIAADLHSALHAAGEQGPFVLVGHSYGGPYAVLFSQYFPADVAGLILVDASHPQQDALFATAGFKPIAASPIQKLNAALVGIGAERLGFGRLFSVPKPPAKANVSTQAVYAFSPESSAAGVRELASYDDVWSEVTAHHDLGLKPLYVLTGDKFPTDQERASLNATIEMAQQHQAIWRRLQNDIATWSRVSRHEVISDAGHCVQCERPDVVAAATKWVVAAVREGKINQ